MPTRENQLLSATINAFLPCAHHHHHHHQVHMYISQFCTNPAYQVKDNPRSTQWGLIGSFSGDSI